ncbi:hypothetical protein [Methanospirillum sp.]
MRKKSILLPKTESEIVTHLAQTGEGSSPYILKQKLNKSYTGVARCCRNIEELGYVVSHEEEGSRGGTKLTYTITLKGILYAIGYQFQEVSDKSKQNTIDTENEEFSFYDPDIELLTSINIGLINPNNEIVRDILKNHLTILDVFNIWLQIFTQILILFPEKENNKKISSYLLPIGATCWQNINHPTIPVPKNDSDKMELLGVSISLSFTSFFKYESIFFGGLDPFNQTSEHFVLYNLIIKEYQKYIPIWKVIQKLAKLKMDSDLLKIKRFIHIMDNVDIDDWFDEFQTQISPLIKKEIVE